MTASLAWTLAMIAQVGDPAHPDDAAARLTFMKDSLATYRVHPSDEKSEAFALRPEPILRMNNPVGGVKDGAIFFWTGEDGRPEAAVQAFLSPDGYWLHELTSLSTGPIAAEVEGKEVWNPGRGGVAFVPVPDAPKPAATPEARLRQMHAIAEDFSAEDYFEKKSWHALRRLAKPLARYGKAGTKVEDGVLVSFALGTDPEVFLLIEARPGPDGPEWRYALAPMTGYQVKAAFKGHEVWRLPWWRFTQASREPFCLRVHSRPIGPAPRPAIRKEDS